jgi:diguanylate cyclase (GGDEF)-like protein
VAKELRAQILLALEQHSRAGAPSYVTDTELAEAMGAPVVEIRRQLDMLEEERLIKSANSHDGHSARISAAGSLKLETLTDSKEARAAIPDEALGWEQAYGLVMSPGETDSLTGLLGRGALDRSLKVVLERASNSQPCGYVMADVDHFKKVNDTHGHPAGDDVLREVAKRLSQTVRGKGRAYRYGGEEMALLLPNHSPSEATAVAERARRAIEHAPVGSIQVTASFGVAGFPDHASDEATLVKAADAALYEAKRLGRNVVRLSGDPPPGHPGPWEPPRREPEPADRAEAAILRPWQGKEIRVERQDEPGGRRRWSGQIAACRLHSLDAVGLVLDAGGAWITAAWSQVILQPMQPDQPPLVRIKLD